MQRSLFVVGDDAQSIYGFRGSKVELILSLEKQYPNISEIILNQNYRSTQSILDLAEKVLSHNPRQKKKDLFTESKSTTKVKYYLARNQQDEAEFIIRQIYNLYVADTEDEVQEDETEPSLSRIFEPEYEDETTIEIGSPSNDPISSMFDIYMGNTEINPPSSLLKYQPTSWSVPSHNWSNLKDLDKCAILYRTHAQSRSLEETFLKHHLPYKLVSGTRFLDRREVKDCLSILKFVSNSQDTISLSRFAPLILSGVGPKTMQKIISFIHDNDDSLSSKHQSLFLDLLSKIQNVWNKNSSLVDFSKDLFEEIGYMQYIQEANEDVEQRAQRIENIGELYSLMLTFDQQAEMNLQQKLENFLAQTSLMSQNEADENNDSPKISLMSLHQAKGLEFETVFLVGVEDGLMPHINGIEDPTQMEEEVRIAYVAVTRAKTNLYLISAESRIQYGQIKANPTSRIFRPFLDSNCLRIKK